MPLQYPPARGEVLIGDFNNLIHHEMDKIRPCIAISPKFRCRSMLTTVVCLSTADPVVKMPYHGILVLDPPISPKFNNPTMWVKGDMIYTVSISRLTRSFELLSNGKRHYPARVLNDEQMSLVLNCVLAGLGIILDK